MLRVLGLLLFQRSQDNQSPAGNPFGLGNSKQTTSLFLSINCIVKERGNKKNMSETGGITELHMLEGEVRVLRKKLAAVEGAEKTSMGCARIVSSIQGSQAKDGFIVTEGSAPNIFHTSAGTSGESSCCVVS